MLYHDLERHHGCSEMTENSVTLHMPKEQFKSRHVVSYQYTAEEVKNTLNHQLILMNLFPIYANNLAPNERLPKSNETVFMIKNNYNIFGHFFLWTGTLVLFDVAITTTFLLYWVFVIQPHKTIFSQDKLINRLVNNSDLILNEDKTMVVNQQGDERVMSIDEFETSIEQADKSTVVQKKLACQKRQMSC